VAGLSNRLPIDEQLETAGELVVRSRIFYDIWRFFEGEETRPNIIDTMNRYSEFFRFDAHAHFITFIIQIAALFENRKDTINLPCLSKELRSAISDVDNRQVAALLDQALPIASKVKILRSNLFAHRSATLTYAESFQKASVAVNELRTLSEIALTMVNRLLSARDLKERDFHNLPQEDVSNMLRALAHQS
jgi:hypothetical protein